MSRTTTDEPVRQGKREEGRLTSGRIMPVLCSRFVVVPLLIAVAVGAWNVYVGLHAHGIIAGRVVDAAGAPVSGATVVLYVRDFVTQNEFEHTSTDGSGGFRFTDNPSHSVQLESRAGAAHSPRVTLRLWFRAQDTTLTRPLRLSGP